MLDVYEAALIRGWIQGVSWTVLGECYLDDAPGVKVRERTAFLRQWLASKAERLGRADLKTLWAPSRPTTEAWEKRALAGLEWLQGQADPRPSRDDAVGFWFPPRLARSLERDGVVTIGALLDRIRSLGEEWCRGVPQCGATWSARVRQWVIDHADPLELDAPDKWFDSRPPDPEQISRGTSTPIKQTGVVPLERFLLPQDLNGSKGVYRAAPDRCTLSGNNDYEAIRCWLGLWESHGVTYRHYRKEAERFLLWAVLTEKTALSSLTTDALGRYRAFLEDPQPAARWAGPMVRRQNPQWKPFQGTLSPRSRQQAETILKGMFRWLVQQNYLLVNAFDGLPRYSATSHPIHVHRAFSETEWQWLLAYCRRQIDAQPQAADRFRRIEWILHFAYRSGLRLRELAEARVGDLERRTGPRITGAHWWLQVTGKGRKQRQVPLVPSLMDQLTINLTARGHGPSLSHIDPDTPLIGRFRKKIRHTVDGPVPVEGPLSESGLHQILRPFFKAAGQALMADDPPAARRLGQATTHWLRHTHGAHALSRGVPLSVIRDNLGHENIATTSVYAPADDPERHEALRRWAEGGHIE